MSRCSPLQIVPNFPTNSTTTNPQTVSTCPVRDQTLQLVTQLLNKIDNCPDSVSCVALWKRRNYLYVAASFPFTREWSNSFLSPISSITQHCVCVRWSHACLFNFAWDFFIPHMHPIDAQQVCRGGTVGGVISSVTPCENGWLEQDGGHGPFHRRVGWTHALHAWVYWITTYRFMFRLLLTVLTCATFFVVCVWRSKAQKHTTLQRTCYALSSFYLGQGSNRLGAVCLYVNNA